MASYNTVITNEGAALLASVIANQGTLTFSEMRFSTTDYDGVEATLTVGTFAGVFITAAASASVVDSTTIKVGAQFDNSGIVGDHPLYSIGIVGTDGNTTALIAVCTTTNPDIIRAALTGVSTYAFNVNLAVSSTLNITVAGTTAAVLYDIDVVDTLISPATDKPLSANQGRVLKENITKPNLLINPFFTINEKGFTTGTVGDYNLKTCVNNWWLTYGSTGTQTVTASANGLSFDVAASDYIVLFQTYDKMPLKAGELFTVSVMLQGGTIYAKTITWANATDTWAVSDDIDFIINKELSRFAFKIKADLDIRAVMVEPGSISTLANAVEPNKNVEIIKCQNPLRVVGTPNVYRGQEITLNADFWAHIADGSFENQQVGDTITLNGRTYTLAHANYWLRTGDTECTTNHWVVISPTMNIGNVKMNSDGSTTGGYLGSGFRSGTNHDSTPNTALADALATIKADFGASHILSHREYLDNAITGGYPSAGTWVNSEAELMSQIMAFGNRFFDPSTNLGATIPAIYSVNKSQLALYAQRPDLLTDRSHWWLRDVASASEFVIVSSGGLVDCFGAENSLGIRLAFGIIA